jgi:uncharacterized phage-like protein YoqJ
MSRDTTCCFTGHRPHRLPWLEDEADARCQNLHRVLEQQVELAYQQGFRHFISGMALGGDLIFCQAVLKQKALHPDILLEAAIPFAGQADRWSEEQKARYHEILEQCDLETLVQQNYTRGCMMRRNQYMVDRSARLIALFDGNPGGGTCNTLLYAIRQALDVVQLDPADF